MDSGEMLKQLLDKFTIEESVIQEELKLVQEQITELESRLEECTARKEQVMVDRQRVLKMMQRYVHGKFEPAPEVLAKMDKIVAAVERNVEAKSATTEPARPRSLPAAETLPPPPPAPAAEPAGRVDSSLASSSGPPPVPDGGGEPAIAAPEAAADGAEALSRPAANQENRSAEVDAPAADDYDPLPRPGISAVAARRRAALAEALNETILPVPIEDAESTGEPAGTPALASNSTPQPIVEPPQAAANTAITPVPPPPPSPPVPPSPPSQPAAAAAGQDSAKPSVDLGGQTEEADDSETMKSINDALRSLFR